MPVVRPREDVSAVPLGHRGDAALLEGRQHLRPPPGVLTAAQHERLQKKTPGSLLRFVVSPSSSSEPTELLGPGRNFTLEGRGGVGCVMANSRVFVELAGS